MFIFILNVSVNVSNLFKFTFHYVYIYILQECWWFFKCIIYIPLCLYLYLWCSFFTQHRKLFTFHYVYIYIDTLCRTSQRIIQFTFHYVYIYMTFWFYRVCCVPDLHSTMFIFIWCYFPRHDCFKSFTFHYVYIYISVRAWH